MNSSRLRVAVTLVAVLAFAVVAAPLGAQTILHFHLSPPTVQPIEGLNQRIQNGDLHLTLEDFLQLVLKNDTAVHLLQLNDNAADYGVIAANSPFDPSITASFNGTRNVQPQTSQISGAETLSSLSQRSSIGYSQVLSSGQTILADFGTNRNSSNALFNTFNPSLGANLGFSFTQPLLQNRSGLQAKTPLLVAKTQVLVVSDQTQASIATDIQQAADQYWQTVQARDQIKVQQQAVNLAQQSYDRNKKMLELGALAPGDIFNPEAQLAQDKTALLQAQTQYQLQLDQIRRLIGADLDPTAQNATLILDDDPSAVIPTPPSMPVNQAIQVALAHRPELNALQRQNLENKFNIAAAHDALRPQLNLTGSYGSNALAGNQIASVTPLGVVVGGSSTGLGHDFNQLFAFNSPTYGFSLQLTLPLRNSRAESQLADSMLAQTQAEYNIRNEEQTIRQDVRLADTQLRMAVEEVKSATIARDLSQKNVDAENQEYLLGTITLFQLLQGQVQLSQAQSQLLSSYTSYQIAKIAYERAVYTLLANMHLKVQP
ncbi:MAG: TolC family protein [Acidobacteria bacterium]|nr:MAG: TolC family protein [Acidobacteriota bacterium]